MRTRRRLRPALDRLDDRCLPSGLTPAQLTHAYGLDAITFTSPSGATVEGDGTGETIALIEAYHDPTLRERPARVRPGLQPARSAAGRGEPGRGASRTRLVAGGVAGRGVGARDRPGRDDRGGRGRARRACQALQAAVNVARNIPAVDVVSMSLGLPRVDLSRVLAPAPPRRATPGITFVAASGDSGLAGGSDWPAVSPNVLAVGGTTL